MKVTRRGFVGLAAGFIGAAKSWQYAGAPPAKEIESPAENFHGGYPFTKAEESTDDHLGFIQKTIDDAAAERDREFRAHQFIERPFVEIVDSTGKRCRGIAPQRLKPGPICGQTVKFDVTEDMINEGVGVQIYSGDGMVRYLNFVIFCVALKGESFEIKFEDEWSLT